MGQSALAGGGGGASDNGHNPLWHDTCSAINVQLCVTILMSMGRRGIQARSQVIMS
jgi:hypothetical protein